MKKVAALAMIVSALSGYAVAESAVEKAPRITLALNGAADQWLQVKPAVNNEEAASKIEAAALSKALERVSAKLDQQLEAKITQDLNDAM